MTDRVVIPFEERPETIRGRAAELAISRWLQQRGWRVLPAYDYAGQGERKAPKLEAIPATASLVVPDLVAVRAGNARWCEVKWKQRADFTRITGRLETGIAARLWEHYRNVRVVSGLEVHLLFVHADEDEVRGAELAYLDGGRCNHGPHQDTPIKRVYHGGKMGRSGMVFFCWHCLASYARTSIIMAEASA